MDDDMLFSLRDEKPNVVRIQQYIETVEGSHDLVSTKSSRRYAPLELVRLLYMRKWV